MQESLVLFESVINSRWFLRTSVILFLNKIDVFKQKLPKVPLVHYFPEYTGGADINKAAKYILWRFTQTNRARLSVYPHLTQATDTSNVSEGFAGFLTTDPIGVCRGKRDDPAKRTARLGHLVGGTRHCHIRLHSIIDATSLWSFRLACCIAQRNGRSPSTCHD
jgi:hypothetical protein